MSTPVCPYCGANALLVTGAQLYANPRDDYAQKRFWRCLPCNAHVGCHPGTERPLGALASKPLREARSRAHARFDPLWRSGLLSRFEAYGLLASQLGIPRAQCHIGLFDVQTCARVESAVAAIREVIR